MSHCLHIDGQVPYESLIKQIVDQHGALLPSFNWTELQEDLCRHEKAIAVFQAVKDDHIFNFIVTLDRETFDLIKAKKFGDYHVLDYGFYALPKEN